jgi:hypothetical protein
LDFLYSLGFEDDIKELASAILSDDAFVFLNN